MTTIQMEKIYYRGVHIGASSGDFAYLRNSSDIVHDTDALRARMEEDGYLYLAGLLDPERVLRARRSIITKLDQEGLLDPAYPVDEAVAREGVAMQFRPDLAYKNPDVEALLYEAEMIMFWERFLGGPVRHLDYTWLRAKAPGDDNATAPHCDTVFMNRGTHNLYTAWTPLGDVPLDFGGLMVLEGSHRREDVLGEYWKMDVDTYCTNGNEAALIEGGQITWQSDKRSGAFDEDAARARRALGGRWLVADYKLGDVLFFGMHTLHAAADNRTNRIRLSTDSRYQLASEQADERWIGAHPVGHGPKGKRGMIC
jgi:ectoine hydroxylase-related dioxygenase (phytanoyl-CoA dioxygenase family)